MELSGISATPVSKVAAYCIYLMHNTHTRTHWSGPVRADSENSEQLQMVMRSCGMHGACVWCAEGGKHPLTPL